MASKGDKIQLQAQNVEVVECEKCHALMVNIDAHEIEPGDLVLLKDEKVRISNPATPDPICINCEIDREDAEHSFKRSVRKWYDSNDDSSFHSSGGGFGGFGGGGFGGFGGGGFSGGGAGRGF